MSIQEALKKMRLELGMSQEDLAEKLNKAFVTVNRWENGKAFPSRANSQKIISVATQYGASEDCLNYLKAVLLPEHKRSRNGITYGFPDIDKDFLFQLADNSANALYVIDAKNYDLVYTNRVAEQLATRDLNEMGKPTNERKLSNLKNKKCYYFFGKRHKPCDFCPLKRLISKVVEDAIIKVPENGRIYNVRANSSQLQGRRVYMMSLTDITKLSAERMALYKMTNDIPVAVGIYNLYLDSRMELIFMNDLYYQMIGEMRRERLMKFGATDLCLVEPEDKQRLFVEIKEALQENRNVEFTMRMQIRDRQYHMVHISARVINQDDEKYTYYCVFTEADEQ